MKRAVGFGGEPEWNGPIKNLELKQLLATKMAERLKKGDLVGVGSGSTSFLTLKALALRRDLKGLDFRAIVTSIEMELACNALSIPTTPMGAERPDWSFDGADEVDAKSRMIKGRGGAILKEKMLMCLSKNAYVVIDKSKRVARLGQNFPVPVEINPSALYLVSKSLGQFKDILAISLRQAGGKDGPVITENGNLMLDVTFSKINDDMEDRLKSIVGVVETGLFIGYPIKLIESD